MTTIVTRAGKGSALTHNEVDTNFTNLNSAKYESGNNATLGTIQGSTITATTGFSGALNGTVGATTPAAGTFTSLSDSGNLTFTGTGNRIVGNFSSGGGSLATRTIFQSSTTNQQTKLSLIPNGSSNVSGFQAFNSTDLENSSEIDLTINGVTSAQISSAARGTGTLLPMTFFTGGSERMRIDTNGNVGIGTSSPISRFTVEGGFSAGATGSQPAITGRGSWGGGIGLFDTATSGFYAQDAGQTLNLFVGQTGSDTAASKVMMVFKGNGNVGIGTSSPSTRLNVVGADGVIARFKGATGPSLKIESYGSNNEIISEGGGVLFGTTNGVVQFYTGTGTATERMRIDSGGNLLVGTTATGQSNTQGYAFNALTGAYLSVGHASGTASGQPYLSFSLNGSAIGSVTQNGTTGVLFNITSDYRLKNNATPLTGATEFIMALQPKSWDWVDGSGKGVGFIAHEFMEVAKYSGNGKKDAVDAEGKPAYQSIQPSSSEVMANLVALVQELKAELDVVKAELNTLKGN
jgi:hypothetical protein